MLLWPNDKNPEEDGKTETTSKNNSLLFSAKWEWEVDSFLKEFQIIMVSQYTVGRFTPHTCVSTWHRGHVTILEQWALHGPCGRSKTLIKSSDDMKADIFRSLTWHIHWVGSVSCNVLSIWGPGSNCRARDESSTITDIWPQWCPPVSTVYTDNVYTENPSIGFLLVARAVCETSRKDVLERHYTFLAE